METFFQTIGDGLLFTTALAASWTILTILGGLVRSFIFKQELENKDVIHPLSLLTGLIAMIILFGIFWVVGFVIHLF